MNYVYVKVVLMSSKYRIGRITITTTTVCVKHARIKEEGHRIVRHAWEKATGERKPSVGRRIGEEEGQT